MFQLQPVIFLSQLRLKSKRLSRWIAPTAYASCLSLVSSCRRILSGTHRLNRFTFSKTEMLQCIQELESRELFLESWMTYLRSLKNCMHFINMGFQIPDGINI